MATDVDVDVPMFLDMLFKLANWRLPNGEVATGAALLVTSDVFVRPLMLLDFSTDEGRGMVTDRVMTGLSRLRLKMLRPYE